MHRTASQHSNRSNGDNTSRQRRKDLKREGQELAKYLFTCTTLLRSDKVTDRRKGFTQANAFLEDPANFRFVIRSQVDVNGYRLFEYVLRAILPFFAQQVLASRSKPKAPIALQQYALMLPHLVMRADREVQKRKHFALLGENTMAMLVEHLVGILSDTCVAATAMHKGYTSLLHHLLQCPLYRPYFTLPIIRCILELIETGIKDGRVSPDTLNLLCAALRYDLPSMLVPRVWTLIRRWFTQHEPRPPKRRKREKLIPIDSLEASCTDDDGDDDEWRDGGAMETNPHSSQTRTHNADVDGSFCPPGTRDMLLVATGIIESVGAQLVPLLREHARGVAAFVLQACLSPACTSQTRAAGMVCYAAMVSACSQRTRMFGNPSGELDQVDCQWLQVQVVWRAAIADSMLYAVGSPPSLCGTGLFRTHAFDANGALEQR
jgi:hypothetical protein